jgi:DNA-binding CsgD family transcriptional regulator
MLVGRDPELSRIDLLFERARAGGSATLALIGEPGIGKTALLEYAVQRAHGMQVLRACGVESEAQIPFASLLELIRPALGMLGALPAPQATALEGALALRPAHAQERFAVGAATLTLLAAYAEREPVAVLIDDAQWLDQPSAQAVLFAIRRLVADPIATLIAVREGEPSLLDGTDLPRARLGGLSHDAAARLLDGISPEHVTQLHAATAGNPLALLELAPDADQLALVPEGGPVLVSTRIADAFVRRAAGLDQRARSALVLAATSDSGDLTTLGRAAATLGVDLDALDRAERAGLVRLPGGTVEFRHPLARSAINRQATGEERRAAHRALAAALPDLDYDRRAWHLASAAIGADEAASVALEQAADRARRRSAYATATAAYERAGALTDDALRRSRLLLAAAQMAWLAGSGDRAFALLGQAREQTTDDAISLDADVLAGHIALRRGPVMEGHTILTAAAERAEAGRAVELLADAVTACFVAGEPGEMLLVAERAVALMPERASDRTRFLGTTAFGMAHILGGDVRAGAAAIHDAIELAESSTALGEDPELLPWFGIAANFGREASTGVALRERALTSARANAAIGGLPFILTLIARHHAGSDNWAIAGAYYREGIALARETDQQTDLGLGLAGLAWLAARRGQEREFRSAAAEALELSRRLGTRLCEIWSYAALGDAALAAGDASQAIEQFERESRAMVELGIVDPDLSPAPELIEAYLRLGRRAEAETVLAPYVAAATAKRQPWSIARARRAAALLADNGEAAALFEHALAAHAETPDVFEQARTQLAYGVRLRRHRDRIGAREQLRAALAIFEPLGAEPWSARARSELAATGETLRRRDPSTIDELTPQELQISLLLAGGKTTREAAAALFLSPKTIEYHLRHVYAKLDIHSREELAVALAKQAG